MNGFDLIDLQCETQPEDKNATWCIALHFEFNCNRQINSIQIEYRTVQIAENNIFWLYFQVFPISTQQAHLLWRTWQHNMSVIFYKFKIAKDSFDSAKFDGSGLSVWDLKREIMIAKKLGKGADFDLVLLNPQTSEGVTLP